MMLCSLVLPACSDNEVHEYDPESRPLTMSIGALDANFNPFFYTSGNDGTVISMTQAGMLASNSKGEIACGEDYPTVVKQYTLKYYDNSGKELAESSATNGNTAYSEYKFLIKNGMKFSDGEDLTIMDVLFSLYVNIDLAYTGSATLYSNDIQGLNAYRYQDPDLGDDDTAKTSFSTNGMQRITNIINYCSGETPQTATILADIETVKKLFLEELQTDWTTIQSSFESRDETYEYNFTETWQAFYLNEGVISIQTETNDNGAIVQLKDENGKYLTDLDKEGGYDYAADIEEAVTEEALEAYTKNGATDEVAREYVIRDYCINYIWEAKTGGYGEDNTIKTEEGIPDICQYWNTASTALEQFTGEERTKYYEELKEQNNGELLVKTISGVTTSRVTEFDGKSLGEEYDVLTIRVNGIDPKAIWNFAFSVCPLHYYSGSFGGKDYIAAAEADYKKYEAAKGDYQITEFGVECGNSTFFTEVLSDTSKNRFPVGAGAYKAQGDSNSFYANKFVNYERNEYFETMGDNIQNAKIKYLKLNEMGDNLVLTNLLTGAIHYGMPNATVENINQLKDSSSLTYTTYKTNGYGYVGINPKFVSDIAVRRVIMSAIDTASPTRNYYSKEYSEVIYRPMSSVSWAYPSGAKAYYQYTSSVTEIEQKMEEAGYVKNPSTGVYSNGSLTCKFTFTIAGSSSDHPAYQMFSEAAEILNQAGFDITVQTSSTALKDLASGNLAVWAAAWTSTIDPDMYQTYHMNSTASSVKNWNYPEILANPTKWSAEYSIITELSGYIDNARETNDQSTRKDYYAKCLDLVMELAVELPTYQRKDCEVYNSKIIKASSLNQNPNCYSSLIDRIWEIDYN